MDPLVRIEELVKKEDREPTLSLIVEDLWIFSIETVEPWDIRPDLGIFSIYYILSITYYLLYIIYSLLSIICYLLSIIYYLSSIIYYPLSIIYYLFS